MSSVDVFVPCYRYGHFLRECVESVLSQSDVSVRVLIIDDASPDNTAEVAAELLREDARVTFTRHSVNKGHIASYNEGIEWASADYMLLLSADDCLLPGALSRAANLMDAHPGVGFTFGKFIALSDDGTETPVNCLAKETDNPGGRILEGLEFIELSGANCIVSTCTAVVRTKVQKLLGGYRRELPHAGDMEMWLRFAAHARVGFVPAYQGIHRRHHANMSSAYFANGFLGDLQQRKVALDCFFESCRDILPDSERLYRKLLRQLSGTAVGFASAAFNTGQMEVSKQVSEFALAVCPQINGSLGWLKLTCKRGMGPRAWHALWPTLARIRGRELDSG
jgi:glycosyltransferase involved in cell wall biosynthesis